MSWLKRNKLDFCWISTTFHLQEQLGFLRKTNRCPVKPRFSRLDDWERSPPLLMSRSEGPHHKGKMEAILWME